MMAARNGAAWVVLAACGLVGCRNLDLPDVPADGGLLPHVAVLEPAKNQVISTLSLVQVDVQSVYPIRSVVLGCGQGLIVAAWASPPYGGFVDLSPCVPVAGPPDSQTGLRSLTLVVTVVDGLGRAQTASQDILLDARAVALRVDAPATVTPHSPLEVRVQADGPLSSAPTVQLDGQPPSRVLVDADAGTLPVYRIQYDDTPGLGADGLAPGAPVTFELLTETERSMRLVVDVRSAVNGNPTHVDTSVLLTRVTWDRPSAGRLALAAADPVATAEGIQAPLATDDLVPGPGSRWLPGLYTAPDGTFVPFDAAQLPGGLDGGYVARALDARGHTLFASDAGAALSFVPASLPGPPQAFTVPFALPGPLTRVGTALCPPDVLGGAVAGTCRTAPASQTLSCVGPGGPVAGISGNSATLSLGSPAAGVPRGSGGTPDGGAGAAYLAPAGPACGDLWAVGTLGGGFVFGARTDPDRAGCTFQDVLRLLPVGDGTFVVELAATCGAAPDFPIVRVDAKGTLLASYVTPRSAPAPAFVELVAALPDGSLVTIRNAPPSTVFERWLPGAAAPANAAAIPGLYALVPGAHAQAPGNVSPGNDGSLTVLLSGGPNGTAVAHFGPFLSARWLYFYPRTLVPTTDAPWLVGAPGLKDAYLLDPRNQRVLSLRSGDLPVDGGQPDAGPPDAGPPDGGPDGGATQCLGPAFWAIDTFDTNAVVNGCIVPSFDTRALNDAGTPWCLLNIQDYHYNDGAGATPGLIGLFDVLNDQTLSRGPWQSFHPSFGGGAFEWIIDLSADAGPQGPVILDGVYQVTDTDPTTWSSDPLAGGICFTAVQVQQAIPGGVCLLLPRTPSQTSPFAFTPGKVGQVYSAQMVPTPPCGTYGGGGHGNFSLASGTLPPGLDWFSDGSIRGTPTTPGDYVFTMTITASLASASQAFSIHVAP